MVPYRFPFRPVRTAWAALLAAGALAACADTPAGSEAPHTGAVNVDVTAASTPFVRCGEQIPVTARVTDARGRAVRDFLVNFNLLAGDGSVYGGAARTDRNGNVQDLWTVGTIANLPNRIAVRAVDPATGLGNEYFTQTVTPASRVAFEMFREIYSMLPDGSDVQRHTSSGRDAAPSWSPEGTRIAFTSDRTGSWQVYTVDRDGTNERQLTTAGGSEPAWSPHGQRIAFVRGGNVYTMTPEGSDVRQLTVEGGSNPAWSRDGTWLAFASNRTGTWQVYVMTAEGTQQRQVTISGGWSPAWSPDGRRIVYVNAVGGTDHIFATRTDGTGMPQRLTHHLNGGRNPRWSPDGGKIIFVVSFLDQLYTMNPDGTGTAPLTSAFGRKTPDWSGCTA